MAASKDNNTHSKYTGLIIGIPIFLLVVSVICLLIFKADTEVFNWISYVGTLFTLAGFAVTIYQLRVVQIDAQNTEAYVKDQIKNTLNTIDIAKAKLLIDFVTDNITAEKYEMAYYRMVELNEILTKILGNDDLKIQMDSDVSQVFGRLTTDTNTIHSYIGKTKSEFSSDMEIISANLNRIRNNINKISNF